MKRIQTYITLLLVMIAQGVMAGIPDGYYSTIDGEECLTLKSRLKDIISQHAVFNYSSLWEYYPSTYFVTDNPTQVLDMYSDVVRFYNNTGTAVGGMNKEHTVPKSWWGGNNSCDGYSDIFNVIPSDQDANGRKSNYSLGIVTDKSASKTWTNGVTTVGTGSVNGFSATFFEPKDEYKGDFARIYFYMATCYPDAAWNANNAVAMTNDSPLTLKAWIIPMLLEWNVMDPVDSDEILRNENIFKVQGNRNPFIDYPELSDYIWGAKNQEIFDLSEHVPNSGNSTGVLYAGAPSVSVKGGTENEPLDIAEGTELTVRTSNSSATLHYRINGGEWEMKVPQKQYNATSQQEYYVAAEVKVTVTGCLRIEAYCTMDGRENSPTVSYWYNGVNFSNEYVLYEAFDEVSVGNNDTNTGSSSLWNGNDNFPEVSKVYQAGNAVKLGTGSAVGRMVSRPLGIEGGRAEVSIDVKGWTNVEGQLKVTMTGAEPQVVSYTATMPDAFETVNLTFEAVASQPTITIETTAKRAFVDNIKVRVSGTSGIQSVEDDSREPLTVDYETKAFNLSGQRVSICNGYKGIVVIGGKKVVR